jgi:hypothetical protein
MTTRVVQKLREDVGPGYETGGTANITTEDRRQKTGDRRECYDSNHLPMSAKRAAGYFGGGLLLLAWLASAGGLMRQTADVPPPPRPVETSGVTSLAAEVHAQTQRLKNRLASAPAPQEPFRNPFAFAPQQQPRVARRAPTASSSEAEAPIGPPLEPAIDLIGVAETETPKGVVRTAIIAALGGELFLVKEGETIAARYRVGAVSADAVELNDLLLGGVRRLALHE